MSKLPLPDANAIMVDLKTGRPDPVWYGKILRAFGKADRAEEDIAGLPAKFQTEAGGWVIEFPDDKDYLVMLNWPYGVTITSITTKCTAGTCTLTGKINGAALGGTANSVSTSEQVQSHTTDNVMVVGDDFSLEVSSNSGCEGLSVTIAGTRTL